MERKYNKVTPELALQKPFKRKWVTIFRYWKSTSNTWQFIWKIKKCRRETSFHIILSTVANSRLPKHVHDTKQILHFSAKNTMCLNHVPVFEHKTTIICDVTNSFWMWEEYSHRLTFGHCAIKCCHYPCFLYSLLLLRVTSCWPGKVMIPHQNAIRRFLSEWYLEFSRYSHTSSANGQVASFHCGCTLRLTNILEEIYPTYILH